MTRPVPFAAFALARLRAPRLSRRRATPALCAAALAVGVVGAALEGWAAWSAGRANADIRALAAGADRAVAADARPHVAHARALFLLRRDRIEDAEALGPAILSARARHPDLAAGYLHTLGAARLRRAFARIEDGALDLAIPETTLAKSALRGALTIDPGHWDAKINLEIAMRLVRDFPREGEDGVEDPDARPRNVWTDLPGLPRGAP